MPGPREELIPAALTLLISEGEMPGLVVCVCVCFQQILYTSSLFGSEQLRVFSLFFLCDADSAAIATVTAAICRGDE